MNHADKHTAIFQAMIDHLPGWSLIIEPSEPNPDYTRFYAEHTRTGARLHLRPVTYPASQTHRFKVSDSHRIYTTGSGYWPCITCSENRPPRALAADIKARFLQGESYIAAFVAKKREAASANAFTRAKLDRLHRIAYLFDAVYQNYDDSFHSNDFRISFSEHHSETFRFTVTLPHDQAESFAYALKSVLTTMKLNHDNTQNQTDTAA